MGAAAAPLAIGFALVSGFVGAMGSVQSGNAEAAALNRNAQIDERNKELTRLDTIQARRTAEIDEEDKRREHRRDMAAIQASYGNSGIELAGSPLDVLQDTAIENALEERRIGYEGEVRGYEGAWKMNNFQEDADQSRVAAKNAKTAGRMQAVGQLLSAGSQAASVKARANTAKGSE